MSKTEQLYYNIDTNDSPLWRIAKLIADNLGADVALISSLEGLDQCADLILDLEDMKSMLKLCGEAVNEQLEARKVEMNQLMIQHDKPYWPSRGKRISPDSKHFYSPANGVGDPLVASWFRDHGRGDVVKEQIHAQTFSAAVREIVEENNGELPSDLAPLVRDTERVTVRITGS